MSQIFFKIDTCLSYVQIVFFIIHIKVISVIIPFTCSGGHKIHLETALEHSPSPSHSPSYHRQKKGLQASPCSSQKSRSSLLLQQQVLLVIPCLDLLLSMNLKQKTLHSKVPNSVQIKKEAIRAGKRNRSY